MSHVSWRCGPLWVLSGAVGLAGLLLPATGAHAGPYAHGPVAVPLGQRPVFRSSGRYYDYDPSQAPRSARPIGPAGPPLTYEELAQRCNIGRLVGGLVGGSVGYGVSRGDGRAWAVPLGALLGTQVGCNVGAGRPPLPW
jgi:hypothetical protein